jgi:SH3-like domain-containing protein
LRKLPSQIAAVALSACLLAAALLASGCRHGRHGAQEFAYVSAAQAILRDHLAAVYEKSGVAKNGERVEVLDRERRFARVRTSSGAEGWVEQRNLVTQDVFDQFQKLARDEQKSPVQAAGITHNESNLHLAPGRDTDHLYQLNEGSKVSLLRRASAEKATSNASAKPGANKSAKAAPGLLEDWWLVRDSQQHVGWILSRMVDLDVPIEIAQYAEGQRMVASFVLNQVNDGDKKISQYLVLFTQPKEGMPFDFDQVRVFTWNVRRHRYETAYRERKLNGVLPVTVSQESFEKEGTLPVFVVHMKDEAGNITERKYKLNTPIVRRVLAPGEQKDVPKERHRG